jgi:uroporphyrinogen-III synthase
MQSMSDRSPAFTELTVLVTRPESQAKFLCDAIIAAGGNVIMCPTLAIQALPDRSALLTIMQHLPTYDLAIFVSANAVKYALPEWPRNSPAQLQIAAIGPATAKLLQQHALVNLITSPPPFNSETLLSLPELIQIHRRRIVIFCGENGKTLLADTLRQRGAKVTVVPVYRRLRPATPTASQLEEWQQQSIDVIISTSCESLQNLHDLLNVSKSAWLKQIPLIVISQQMANLARELGFVKPPYIAANATDTALLEALKIWYDIKINKVC